MRLWSLAVYLFLPYALVALVWRGLRYPAYFRHWPERFGFVTPLHGKRVIWVHAVSVGEVRSAVPLIEQLAERAPHHRILVTTMTPTGKEQVESLFGDRVDHSYLPYDFPDGINRFLNRVRPELAIIAETEFWPNLFASCSRRGIPLTIVNARLSPASYRKYAWVGRTARRMFASANYICAQSSLDAQRLRNLGVSTRQLSVTGNLKFDVALPDNVLATGAELREQWGRRRPVLVAASTHRGEERALLAAIGELRQQYPDLLTVIVPRHPERFAAVYRLCRRQGFVTERRTALRGALPGDVQVLVGDTMGELYSFYAAADIAVIGGSFVRHGGQNPLEAYAVGIPAIFGPHMYHFEEISALSLESGAASQVFDRTSLVEAVTLWLEQPALRREAGHSALELVRANRGSLDRTLHCMQRQLARASLEAPAAAAESTQRAQV